MKYLIGNINSGAAVGLISSEGYNRNIKLMSSESPQFRSTAPKNYNNFIPGDTTFNSIKATRCVERDLARAEAIVDSNRVITVRKCDGLQHWSVVTTIAGETGEKVTTTSEKTPCDCV